MNIIILWVWYYVWWISVRYVYIVVSMIFQMSCRGGLVGYDAASTQLRSGFQIPSYCIVCDRSFFSTVCCFLSWGLMIMLSVYTPYIHTHAHFISYLPLSMIPYGVIMYSTHIIKVKYKIGTVPILKKKLISLHHSCS